MNLNIKWYEIAPVLVSIGVIITIAILQRQSKLVAAITATMPLNIPLALWIVYSANRGDQEATTEFIQGMLIGIIPTVCFLAAIWLAARAGLKLVPLLVVGYATWGAVLAVVIGVRRLLGV